MTQGIIVSPANRGVQVVVTDENNVQLLVDSNRGVSLEIVPQPRIEVLVDKGVEGAQGPVGPQGPQGPQGTAATVAAGTTTTGLAGTNAIVTNSGTSSAAVFDFTIPRGDTGATGATGAGVAVGGTTGQVLVKASGVNYDTTWATITGTLVYQGSWNAATNTPTLTSSVGTNGYYYVVGTSGSTNLNGITDWVVGDWVIFNGTIWQKIDNTDLVSSVNGQTGVVVLTASSVGALAIANNLSDLANTTTARTNLGLGSIATQNANAVAITGGTIDNTVIGGTTPAAGTFTTLTANTSVTTPIVGAATGSSTTGLDLNVNSKAQARIVEVGDGTRPLVINGGSAGGAQIPGISVPAVLGISAGGGNPIRFYTNGRVTTQQLEVSHTASAVNYVQVTGAATGASPTISAQGSDTNATLRLGGKGSGTVDFASNGNPYAFQVVGVASGANYNSWRATSGAGGSGASSAPVMSTWGIDTNISAVFQSKGTGAIDLAAGSSGVNISNGGTVTAITRTNGGSTYTSFPTLTISAPTTAGGVQATASFTMGLGGVPVITSGGTGYTVGNVLTLVGGTFSSAATLTVSTVSSGVVTGVTVSNFGTYTVLPTNPISVTGGTGSGATFSPTWGVNTTFTITNAGSGYVEQPTVSFSGGGGSGAAAYAVVGGTNTVRSIGGTLNFATPGGTAFSVSDTSRTTVDFWQAVGATGTVGLVVAGATGNNNGYISAKGTGYVGFATNSFAQEQMRVSHTASAVNYLQSTGGATGGAPTISAQGSDTNIGLNLTTKGTGGFNFASSGNSIFSGNGGTHFRVRTDIASATGFWEVFGSTAGPIFRSTATTGQIQTSGGQLSVQTDASGTTQLAVAHTASAVNFVQVTGAATGVGVKVSAQGSDTNIPVDVAAKGTGLISLTQNGIVRLSINANDTLIGMNASGTPALQAIPSAGAVNLLTVRQGATGFGAVLGASGSDTNIPLVLQPKGTGALQAQQTDSTATGGNARGANAVDWQTNRDTAAKVASGQYATISGGYRHTASGFSSTVSGGEGNSNSGYVATISGGSTNTSSGSYAAIAGGYLNTISKDWSFVGAGYGNTAAGYHNFIGSGYSNSGTSTSAVTTQSATMNGTTAVTLSGSNANIKVGQLITGTSIGNFPNTYVAAISGTSLTLSQAASGSSTSTLSFFTPHGVVVGGGNNQATGSYSFIGGGGDAGSSANRNVASGAWSTVGGGWKNTASGLASFIGGGGTYDGVNGSGNVASGIGSFVASGWGNNASSNAANAIGVGNVANGQYSTVIGYFASAKGIIGNIVFGANSAPLGQGANQGAILVLAKQTTDATATVITSDGSAASSTNQVILPNNSAYFFTGEVVAGVTGGGNTKGWTIEGVIKRGANAASTTLVGSTVTSMYADVGAATWTIALSADTTNGGLAVTFTGQASTTIRVVCQIRSTEMTF